MVKFSTTKHDNLLRADNGIYYWREKGHTLSTGEKSLGRAKRKVDLFRREYLGEFKQSRHTFEEALDLALMIKKDKSPRTYTEARMGDQRMRSWLVENYRYLDMFERNYEEAWAKYKSYAYAENLKKIGRKGKLDHDRKHLLYVMARAANSGWVRRRYQKTMFPLEEVGSDHGRALDDTEIHETLALCRANDTLSLQVRIALAMGMRKGEILGLAVGEVDLNGREINLMAGRVKTRTARKIPIPISDAVYTELKEKINESLKQRGRYVFPFRNMDGTLDYSRHQVDLGKEWRRISKETNCTFKDLRATCATNLVAAGLPIPAIAKILGHSIKMLNEIYDRVHKDVRQDFRKVFAGKF